MGDAGESRLELEEFLKICKEMRDVSVLRLL